MTIPTEYNIQYHIIALYKDVQDIHINLSIKTPLHISDLICIYIYTIDLQLGTIKQILLCKRQPGCSVKKSIYKREIKDSKNWC